MVLLRSNMVLPVCELGLGHQSLDHILETRLTEAIEAAA